MTNDERRSWAAPKIIVVVASLAACTTPNPIYRGDASVDTPADAVVGPVCTATQALRCDGSSLVRCNDDGTGEVSEHCPLGCNATAKRCAEVVPSNGLGQFLAQAPAQPHLNLGEAATINTDNGDVAVSGSLVQVRTEVVAQSGAPIIRVLVVQSLTAKNVVVTGKHALAVVSSGDITIRDGGVFAVSSKDGVAGPGAYEDGGCRGGPAKQVGTATSGRGGDGFGSPGGPGGSASSGTNFAQAGAAGGVTGNDRLVPLRGGCADTGGGALQFVSGTRITITGIVAANGGGNGGSGGGVLIEAPVVDVPGRIVANGGGGGPGGQSGRTDTVQAPGEQGDTFRGTSGLGAAGSAGATGGETRTSGQDPIAISAGHGGGGFGRIRLNTASGSQPSGGLFSPIHTVGTLAVQ